MGVHAGERETDKHGLSMFFIATLFNKYRYFSVVKIQLSKSEDLIAFIKQFMNQTATHIVNRNVAGRGDPFQGPRVGSLTLGNELSEETHVLTKQET